MRIFGASIYNQPQRSLDAYIIQRSILQNIQVGGNPELDYLRDSKKNSVPGQLSRHIYKNLHAFFCLGKQQNL